VSTLAIGLMVDEDLAGMYLTEKSRGKQRDVDQHDEVELLLEAYVKQVDGIVQEADQLASNMKNTEEIVNIILDANRNSLMLLDLKVPLQYPWLTIGFNDNIGYRIRCCYCRSVGYELEELHGGLGIWLSGHHVVGVRDEYIGVWIWTYEIEEDTKVDAVWTVSWS
jgi:hypothetical protein